MGGVEQHRVIAIGYEIWSPSEPTGIPAACFCFYLVNNCSVSKLCCACLPRLRLPSSNPASKRGGATVLHYCHLVAHAMLERARLDLQGLYISSPRLYTSVALMTCHKHPHAHLVTVDDLAVDASGGRRWRCWRCCILILMGCASVDAVPAHGVVRL